MDGFCMVFLLEELASTLLPEKLGQALSEEQGMEALKFLENDTLLKCKTDCIIKVEK